MTRAATRNLTILLTDIKGFTDKTSQKSRSEIQEMLDDHKAIVLPILESKGGKLIKTIGDAFLVVFESPTDAVLAGVAVQDALDQFNADKPRDDRLEIRIAINAGEVNLADNDIFGEPVNITARIEGVAEAGEVFFTEAVYLAMNRNEVPSSTVGLLQLKGVPEKIRVYKVKRERPIGASASHHFLDRLKTAIPSASSASSASTAGLRDLPSEAPVKAKIVASGPARPKAIRRAIALGIDALICSVLVGMFAGKNDRSVHVKYDHDVQAKAKAGAAIESAVRQALKNGGVRIGDDGVQVGSGKNSLSIDDNGIHGRAGGMKVAVDSNGINVAPSKGSAAKPASSDAGFWAST